MPEVAPVAVEPREFKKPSAKTAGLAAGESAVADPPQSTDPEGATRAEAEIPEKKSLPLIPILAGVVGVVVLGLLVKVLSAK